MIKKAHVALAAFFLIAAFNVESLQAAEEAASLDGERISYDMATGDIEAEGDVVFSHGTASITGKKARYNVKAEQGEITGGVVVVDEAMRLTAETLTLENADKIYAVGGAEVVKDDLHLKAAKLAIFSKDRYVAEGDVYAQKEDKIFTGARAEYTQSLNYVLIEEGGTLQIKDAAFTADRMEGSLAKEHYLGSGNVHIISALQDFEGGGDQFDYFANEEDGRGKCVLSGNAWAYQGNNTLKSRHLTVYLANSGEITVK